jgi:large subunit ribosomal protein L29
MKAAKLRELSPEELASREAELKEELYNLRFQNQTGQIENPVRMRLARRELARVKTILKERAGAEKEKTDLEEKDSVQKES